MNDVATPVEVLQPKAHADWPFWLALALLGSVYVLLIGGMLLAQASFTSPDFVIQALASPGIRHAIKLSLLSSTLTTLLALWVAVPMGYLMARWDDQAIRRALERWAEPWRRWSEPWPLRPLRGVGWLIRMANPKPWLDALLDIPIVLPPLVIGLALLILFQAAPARWFETHVLRVTSAVPAVILAQFTVASAFAVRTMRVTFEQISPRAEQVALTLGCSQSQAFWNVVLPESRGGLMTATTLAWARSLGEFGPILVFAGATRLSTEVMPTSVYLELGIGNLEGALALSMLMIFASVSVLILMRKFGQESTLGKALRP